MILEQQMLVYNNGLLGYTTPNIDRIGNKGGAGDPAILRYSSGSKYPSFSNDSKS